jgi:predicted transcriptional regulator
MSLKEILSLPMYPELKKDQIQYIQVLDGLKDAEEGKFLTTEKLLKRVEQWAK